ncbi:diguanylate cyclase [Halopseudomonas salina]|uniref:Deoxynucleoside kinase n=1 Tax=Halopseudomonas salina TaxID=1323744 RepID=A0ABQ1PXP9_9GAMM|nr:diguanylate cyclase [Halopseudomonas salina]GGD06755.1 deoxynucleoside kinase [Halopseudomonas salina]
MRCFALIWLFLLTGTTAQASAPLIVDNATRVISDLQPHVSYFRDQERQLLPDQVMEQPSLFQPASQREGLNFSYTRDRLWLKATVTSTADRRTDWILEMRYPSLDRVTLYNVGADGTVIQHQGDTLPYQQRDMKHRNPIFKLYLEPGESRTLFVAAHSEGSLTLDAQLWQAEHFYENSQASYAILATYFGMLLALAIYNLLLFAVLRERSFVLYVCFVVAFGAGVAAINGLGAQFIWPNLGEHGNRILPFSLSLSAAVGVLFARSFLDTARRTPLLDSFLAIFAWMAMLATLTTLIIPIQPALQLMSVTGLLTTLVLFTAGMICVVKGIPGARIFVIAWLMLLVGGMLLGLRNFGLIPSNFVTVNAMQIGSAVEMLLLSLGLAARFNELKRLKEQAQLQALSAQKQVVQSLVHQERILALRVAERTEALAEANKRLELLAMQDPLTGLGNRSALGRHLPQAMQRTARRGELLALVLIDLDGFKAINDELGHDVGDQVLVGIASRLSGCARQTDLVARLGGDEFILISEGIADQEDALQQGQRLLDVMSMPLELEGVSVSVGASVGISLSNGVEPDIETLMRQADQAMYQRKRSGRHGVVLHTASPPEKIKA